MKFVRGADELRARRPQVTGKQRIAERQRQVRVEQVVTELYELIAVCCGAHARLSHVRWQAPAPATARQTRRTHTTLGISWVAPFAVRHREKARLWAARPKLCDKPHKYCYL